MFYNEINKVERGLFFQTGAAWSRLRKVMNKVMLADHGSINSFAPDIVNINSDVLRSWKEKCQVVDDRKWIIDDVKMELCKWSIESTGYMLFGDRMGCIPSETTPESDSRAQMLVENVANMFTETSRLQVIPVKLAHRLNLGVWKRFEQASSTMIQLANEYVEENMMKQRNLVKQNSIMRKLLGFGSLSEGEVSRSMVDLIIAAADTTSNSLQWMLYMIAKRQDVQLKILEEVIPLFNNPGDLEKIHEKAPYLRAFLREVSRLYPTAPFLARTLSKDIVLGGYLIPAGKPIVLSLFTTSRMSKYFEDPLAFKPERWLRNINKCPVGRDSAFASLPFGFGARSCIGRRAAELQMSLFIASFVREFDSSLAYDVDIKLNMILTPSRPIKLNLKAR
ncbi:cytochrome P450 315a1, mitochondrial [Olea europaea subsp. europaea]|uniref:Cytochrome P450 315a1, mitochondrial n=1 Tax=Olea europaea subsp. europaea TaxID=158383 RepID=A0A8S0Q5N7_OLEEU|nr:cytochrome P450 315a1, mitochondrial [Olea europaea subsp. europaea]